LKLTLLQTDIRWAQPDLNMQDAARLMDQSGPSDLYVLPEMWSTGFATEPDGIAHDEHDNTALLWMRQQATSRQCAICGSLAVRLADGTYRNRHYFVDGRHRQVCFYDKHHLFTYGHENQYYTAGTEHCIVAYEGFRLLLLTCYDLRFPCWSRYATGREYDAIVVVANWPQSRQSAWQILTRARAIENQAYLIGVNRVGDDHYSHYAGASVVVDPIGRTIGQCRQNIQQSLTVDIQLAELQRRRQKFRVLDDRDAQNS
jgi:predicted amidohydrolase